MKIGLVGPSYEQWSLPFNAQRTINLYPIKDDSGAEVSALYGTAGLQSFAVAGNGPIRGGFKSAKTGRVFFVSGSTLYEVEESGAVTDRGSLNLAIGRVTMCEGTTQLGVCDNGKVYCFTYATNALTQVTDDWLPSSVGYITNIDGYFVANNEGTGRFHISAINDITAGSALDYATAESSPDNLEAPVSAVGQLWLFGEETTEIWTNTGNSSFPFQRIAGAVMQVGALARHTAMEVDNSVMWVGRDKFGSGIVYRANGFTPQRISTTPIEKRIREAIEPEELYAWAYQEDGHLFYVISGGGLETSLVYDLNTKLWHERSFLNAYGKHEQHLGACHVFAFGKHLVGSRKDGKIFELSKEYYSDDGEEIARERTYTHLIDEGRAIRYNALEIGLETGVGLQAGNGSDPLVSLQLSKDGARTWSSWFTAPIGKVGEYQTKVKFRRLGVAEQMTFKIRITDKVKVAIIGSYLN